MRPPGIQPHYVDALGRKHRVPRETIEALRRALRQGGGSGRQRAGNRGVLVVAEGARTETGPATLTLEDGRSITVDRVLPRGVPPGYHQIERRRGGTVRLIVSPAACFLHEDYATWGWAIQLYAARSRKSWGIGDLADLRWLGEWAASAGAGLALVNPLAAAAPVVPQQPSPYFPSSRRFRNPLFLRIEEIDGAREARLDSLAGRARALNRERLIHRDQVFRLKMQALERIWRVVGRRDNPRFARFVDQEGDGLREFATYCALAERHGGAWRSWPAGLRHPASPRVRRLSQELAFSARVRFHQWLQFETDEQLARASLAMPVMQDLPIGFDSEGADAWAFQDVLARDVTVGAPPDEFNTQGQNWGLPPFVPDRLREAGYEPFIQTIRGCLRHAGGLRIDHVMGLFRLFWIPQGTEPADGAYVEGHAADLLSIVALESQRARAVIVGEDLGTVDESARDELMARRILSYRLVWFEKVRPPRFPEQALAAVTTHDLPTVAGLWSGSDLELQHELGLAPNEKGTREIVARVKRLTRTGPSTPIQTVVARLHEALAKAPSRILTATLEDAMAVEERPNMPATTNEHPNWSMALPRPIETLNGDPVAERIGRALCGRGRARQGTRDKGQGIRDRGQP